MTGHALDGMSIRAISHRVLIIHSMKTIPRLGLLSLASVILASCSTGGRSPSGFLANHAQLGHHGGDDAVTSYVKQGVDLRQYNSVIIDPVVTIVAAPGVSPQVSDQLAAYLVASLRGHLGSELSLTSVRGPGTLRVRAAITDVVEGHAGGKPVTTVHTAPQVSLDGTLGSQQVADFISHAAFEGEILDSVSGERLCAFADHRIGAKREATPATTWLGVRSAVNQAALKLKSHFVSARQR